MLAAPGPTHVCVAALPAACPVCCGPYVAGRATTYDPAEADRFRCPVCRWHVYLRPVPPLAGPWVTLRGWAVCEDCGTPFRRRGGGPGRRQRFCCHAHANRHWWKHSRAPARRRVLA